MKFLNILLLIISVIAIYAMINFGERHISTKMDEAIENSVRGEIDSLKERLDKQSELISSLIGLSSSDNTDVGSELPVEDSKKTEVEFEYIAENGGITITKYTGKQTSVQIPEKIEGMPVIKIGKNAFAESKVKSVTLPSSCIEIDWFAFYGCFALSTVYIPSSVQAIGYGAFDSCSKSITIYGEKGSYALQYASSFGISCSEIH